MVRAKMVCESKEGSDENKQFYKWTPSGQIQLNTVNVSASAYFEIGKEYYVDFNIAE